MAQLTVITQVLGAGSKEAFSAAAGRAVLANQRAEPWRIGVRWPLVVGAAHARVGALRRAAR